MKALRAKLYSMKLEEETSKRYNQRKIQVRSAACRVSTQQSKNNCDSHVSGFKSYLCFSPRLAPEADRRRFGRITLPRTALQTTGLA